LSEGVKREAPMCWGIPACPQRHYHPKRNKNKKQNNPSEPLTNAKSNPTPRWSSSGQNMTSGNW